MQSRGQSGGQLYKALCEISVIQTRAPAAVKVSAMGRPMPEPTAVMSTVGPACASFIWPDSCGGLIGKGFQPFARLRLCINHTGHAGFGVGGIQWRHVLHVADGRADGEIGKRQILCRLAGQIKGAVQTGPFNQVLRETAMLHKSSGDSCSESSVVAGLHVDFRVRLTQFFIWS
jgi:hypothetical protein